MSNKLFLIPTALSDDAYKVIPSYVTELIHTLDEFVVENEKSARQFLKKTGYQKSLNDVVLHSLNEHSDIHQTVEKLIPIFQHKNLGLLSEAGCPAVADPGSELVAAAHRKNIEVIPLVGPSSIMLSLMASGLNGQSFSFAGYLPKERQSRINAIKELEKAALKKNQTQIFIEAPYRNQHFLEDILGNCHRDTRLCIAVELTGANEYIKTNSISDWKKKIPDIQKRPAIFLIGR